MGAPVVTVASGGIAVTEVANGLPIDESTTGGMAVTIVASGGLGVTYGAPPSPNIQLSASSIAEDATSGTTVGALSVSNGSGTYTFTETADPDSKFAVSGSNLNTAAALNYETATSHSVTIQADNGVDTPISRTFTISVTNVLEVTLAALTLSAASFTDGATSGTVIGAIQNKTTGSTLSISPADGRVSIDGSDNLVVGLTSASVGTFDITIRETHPDGSNSPRDTALTITVNEVSTGLDLVVIGDSISTGDVAGVVAGTSGGYLTEAETYPEIVKALIEDKQATTVNLFRIAASGKSYTYNFGSGMTLNQMVADGTIGINALISAGRRADCKVVVYAGTNGMALASNSGATEYTGLTTLLDYLTGQGYTAANISVITCVPRDTGGSFNSERLDFNARIKADAGTRGYSQVRIDESLGFNDADDNSQYAYQPDFPTSETNGRDLIHLGWVGHKILGHFLYDGGHYAGGLFPGATFDPAVDLPTPLVFDPADYNATTGNWPSKTGSAVSVTLAQATSANRPAAGTLNGLPAVEFTGGTSNSDRDYLQALATGYGTGGVYLNAATAYFADAYQDNSFIYNFGDAVSGWDTGPRLSYSGGGWQFVAFTDTTGPHVLTAPHGTNSGSLIINRVYYDDLWQLTTDNHPHLVTPAFAPTDLTVGGANQFRAQFGGLDGRMGDLIFWKPPEPNDYWIHRVQRYLKEKYATP